MKKKTFQAMFLTLVLTGSLSVLPAAEELPAETETESLIETETEALFETESAVLTEAGTEALLAEDGTESLLSEDGTEALSETETEPLTEAQPLPPVPMDLMKGAETITADNREAYFTDADNAPTDSMFYIEADARIANTPLGNSISRASAEYTDLRSVAGYLNGTLVTVSSGDLIRYQMFIDVYFRQFLRRGSQSVDPLFQGVCRQCLDRMADAFGENDNDIDQHCHTQKNDRAISE